jgi:hypothetical protein
MTRAACTFRQRDLTAAVKAARAAGCEVTRVEVDREGKIVVVMGGPATKPIEPEAGEESAWRDADPL